VGGYGGDDDSVDPFLPDGSVDYAKLERWRGIFDEMAGYGIFPILHLHEGENKHHTPGDWRTWYRAAWDAFGDLRAWWVLCEECNHPVPLSGAEVVERAWYLDQYSQGRAYIGIHNYGNLVGWLDDFDLIEEIDFYSVQWTHDYPDMLRDLMDGTPKKWHILEPPSLSMVGWDGFCRWRQEFPDRALAFYHSGRDQNWVYAALPACGG